MTRLIRTTVTVEFRPPDAASSVPLARYRESVQMDMHRWLLTALQGCHVQRLDIDCEQIQE